MIEGDLELLGRYVRERSEDAFAEIVRRYVDFVYSAAFRQVRSPQLAEEVLQSVFADLARQAGRLSPKTILSAWLYQVARRTAVDVVRGEARRQLREQIAGEIAAMNTIDDWSHVEPLLDEAMSELDDGNRAAVLLRYFENKSLSEVGRALGTSEDAARKRVSRAVEQLREGLAKRGVAVGAGSLAAAISANAIQAAPAGLGAAITAAALGSAAAATSTTLAIATGITMTTLQKTIVAALITGAVGTAFYQVHQSSQLRRQVQTLKQEQAGRDSQLQELRLERDRATNTLGTLSGENAALRRSPNETLRLRGEVGRLRKENEEIGSSSPVSKITANPELRKMLRDQQRRGMELLYNDFAKRINLPQEQKDEFMGMLADHIMANVDNVTIVLRDKLTLDQADALFAAQDAALKEKVAELCGPEGAAQYDEYTRNMLSKMSAEQFSVMLTGSGEEKAKKLDQFRQVLQESVQAQLASSGLPADYQTIPVLNFANIASEEQGERSLKLLGDIYARAAERSDSFLTREELGKFQEFRTAAISGNRSALALNRTMMAPISQ